MEVVLAVRDESEGPLSVPTHLEAKEGGPSRQVGAGPAQVHLTSVLQSPVTYLAISINVLKSVKDTGPGAFSRRRRPFASHRAASSRFSPRSEERRREAGVRVKTRRQDSRLDVRKPERALEPQTHTPLPLTKQPEPGGVKRAVGMKLGKRRGGLNSSDTSG